MPRISVEAPAKVNLHLHVGERRSDGFHDIESLFLALAYGDTLSFETNLEEPALPSETMPSTEIILDWQLPWGDPKDLSPEKNIVNRAISLFRERTGFDKKLKIVMEKRIPLGGGLGGGSSDAAATLLALNRLASPGGTGLLSATVLTEMGASLGSDIPFFLQTALNDTPTAWVSGRGEHVQPFAAPAQFQNLSFVLVNPGIPSDTAKAFRLLDEYRATAPRSPTSIPHSSFLIPHSPHDWPFTNDFMPVFEAGFKQEKLDGRLFSVCREIICTLKDLGAEFSGLSGSGSTCFGVFANKERASTAKETLLLRWNFVIETFCLRSKRFSATINSK